MVISTQEEMIRADQSSTQVIDSMHLDYVNQVAFSPYGRRLATSSGDRFVRVFDLTDNGDWVLSAQWQAHRGAVTSLCWAHPEFGSLLATCGSDQDAKLWEERSHTSSLGSRWSNKASLTEARRAVTCLEFAPRQWGLKLAVGSADGCVRIYEAIDIMNLTQWPLGFTVQAFAEGNKLGCTCLSWCNGRFEPPTLVAGGSNLVVYRYSEAAREWQALMTLPSPERGDVLDVAWAPNVGRRYVPS
jgi:nucleoporin SEH1